MLPSSAPGRTAGGNKSKVSAPGSGRSRRSRITKPKHKGPVPGPNVMQPRPVPSPEKLQRTLTATKKKESPVVWSQMILPRFCLPECAAPKDRSFWSGGYPWAAHFSRQQTKLASLAHRFTSAVPVLPFALTHHATFVVRYWRKQKLVGCYHPPSSYLPQWAIGTIPHFSAAVNAKQQKTGLSP